MVSIYFDKDFIEIFQKRDDLTSLVIYDFYNKFIKKTRGVNVLVNLETIEELEELISENEFWHFISEISPIKLDDFKPKLSINAFYSDGPISKIFFVENCNEEELQKQNGYIFISNQSLSEKWKLFLSDSEENELVIKSRPEKSEFDVFRSWLDINSFPHLIKHILIFDLYIMCDKKDQKIKNNLIPLLAELLKFSHGNTEELTIFTKELQSQTNKKETQGLWLKPDIEASLAHFKDLKKRIKSISLIKYDKSKNTKADSEHNRCIITNYFLIRTEAGFNVYKDNGLVNNRDTIKFDSVLKNKSRKIISEMIRNLSQYTSQIKQIDSKGVGVGDVINHYNYYPTANIRFLRCEL